MEQKKVAEPDTSNMGDKLQYLIAQSDVFAHFLAGSVAAADKKKKGKKSKKTSGMQEGLLRSN